MKIIKVLFILFLFFSCANPDQNDEREATDSSLKVSLTNHDLLQGEWFIDSISGTDEKPDLKLHFHNNDSFEMLSATTTNKGTYLLRDTIVEIQVAQNKFNWVLSKIDTNQLILIEKLSSGFQSYYFVRK
jgi:hypothetical protein